AATSNPRACTEAASGRPARAVGSRRSRASSARTALEFPFDQETTMIADLPRDAPTAWSTWTGRIVSGLVVAFLLVDGAIKLVPIAVVTETMAQLGWPASDTLARVLGVLT